MPHGLPGAIKTSRPTRALAWPLKALPDGSEWFRVSLPMETLMQPLYPMADQDGFDGDWLCRKADDGRELVVERLALFA